MSSSPCIPCNVSHLCHFYPPHLYHLCPMSIISITSVTILSPLFPNSISSGPHLLICSLTLLPQHSELHLRPHNLQQLHQPFTSMRNRVLSSETSKSLSIPTGLQSAQTSLCLSEDSLGTPVAHSHNPPTLITLSSNGQDDSRSTTEDKDTKQAPRQTQQGSLPPAARLPAPLADHSKERISSTNPASSLSSCRTLSWGSRDSG